MALHCDCIDEAFENKTSIEKCCPKEIIMSYIMLFCKQHLQIYARITSNSFQSVMGRCEYGICCCYFYLKYYDESLKHLRRSQELRACSDVDDDGELLQLNDHLEEALIEWFCGDSVHSVETIQEIANRCRLPFWAPLCS